MKRTDTSALNYTFRINYANFGPFNFQLLSGIDDDMPNTDLSMKIALLLFIPMAGLFQRDGYAERAGSQVALSQPLTIRWRYDSDQTLNLTPAFDNERIYLPLEGELSLQ